MLRDRSGVVPESLCLPASRRMNATIATCAKGRRGVAGARRACNEKTRGGRGGGQGKGEVCTAPGRSIDNYSFRRVAPRGQIPILKRPAEREGRREVYRPVRA